MFDRAFKTANFNAGLTMNWLRRLEIQEIYSSSLAAAPNSVLPLQPEARITANNQVFSLHLEAQHGQEASFQLSIQTAR